MSWLYPRGPRLPSHVAVWCVPKKKGWEIKGMLCRVHLQLWWDCGWVYFTTTYNYISVEAIKLCYVYFKLSHIFVNGIVSFQLCVCVCVHTLPVFFICLGVCVCVRLSFHVYAKSTMTESRPGCIELRVHYDLLLSTTFIYHMTRWTTCKQSIVVLHILLWLWSAIQGLSIFTWHQFTFGFILREVFVRKRIDNS